MPVVVKRLTASSASLASHCAHSFRSDVRKAPFIPSTWTLIGNAFDDAVQIYPQTPDWEALIPAAVERENETLRKAFRKAIDDASKHGEPAPEPVKPIRLIPSQQKKLIAQYDHWRRWAVGNYPADSLVEHTILYDPITGSVRTTPEKFPKSDLGEWFVREDLISPDTGVHWNWKTGHKQVEHPETNWQFKATRVAMAAAWGLDTVTSVLFQVSETGYRNPAHTATRDQLEAEREEMVRVSLRMLPNAGPNAGDWCESKYCDARFWCPAYAAMKTEREKNRVTEEVSVSKPVTKAPQSSSRMSLSRGKKGIIDSPIRAVIYGVEGVGKSYFAAGFPNAKWLSAESGTEHLDVDRFEAPETWDHCKEAVQTLLTEDHDFKTFVFDPLGWGEILLMAEVCKKFGWATPDDAPFGRAYKEALPLWKEFLDLLDRLRNERGMHVVLVAHSEVKQQKSPDTEDFERYQLAMGPRAAAMIKQWADIVGFMRFELTTRKVGLRVKGSSSGDRVLHVRWSAAYDAKNRYNLPGDIVEPTYARLMSAIKDGRRTPETVLAEIQSLLAEINQADVSSKAEQWIEEANGQLGPLCEILEGLKNKQQEGEAA